MWATVVELLTGEYMQTPRIPVTRVLKVFTVACFKGDPDPNPAHVMRSR